MNHRNSIRKEEEIESETPNCQHIPNSIRGIREPFHKRVIRALLTQTTHKTTAVFLFHVGIELDWIRMVTRGLVNGIGINLAVVAW